MSIRSYTLKDGASSVNVVGGTDQTFQEDGMEVAMGIHVSDVNEANFSLRESATMKSRPPVLQGVDWTKEKKSVTHVKPMITDSGKTVFNLVRIELETHPSIPAADRNDLLLKASQYPVDTDFTSFWVTGSKA